MPAQLLMTLIVALVLLLVYEWLPAAAPAVAPVAPARLTRGTPAETRVVARDTEGWAATILARPLFSISRKPPKPPAVHSAGAEEGLPRLSGIMIFGGEKRAIFAPESGGKPLVLSEGASLSDTSIRTIEPGRVILASGEVLRPAYDKNRIPAATPEFAPADMAHRPGFVPPGFPNPAFPNPGFQGAGFPTAPLQTPAADGNDAAPLPSPPPFRGLPQQRRE